MNKLQYFILNIHDTEKELDSRLKKKQWPIYEKTKHAGSLEKDDLVIFYQAGADFHVFAGEAVIESISLKDEKHFKFSSVKKWKNKVNIKEIYEELEIIKKPSHYGAYLAGGIHKISKNDYDLVISKSS